MSSNTENTEAKLAAYIDGQLDPAERAQIEQYLQANPEHRKLLADMIAQRDVLRSLPRDKAPADIYDAIQAQLERSVLLDDSAHAAAPAVRHGRRSSLLAIAAILTLAAGLGAVLYFALPSTRPSAIEVASSNQPTTTSSSNEMATEQAPIAGTAASPRTKPSTPALAEAPTPSLTPATLSNATPTSPTHQALADTATPSPSDAGQLVLLVSTDDPSKVNRQVETYLESNKIRWEAVNAPADHQVLYSRAAGGLAAPVQQLRQKAPPAPAEKQLAAAEQDANRALDGTDLAKKSEADKTASSPAEWPEAAPKELADAATPHAGQPAPSDHAPAGATEIQPLQAPQKQQQPQQQVAGKYFYSTPAEKDATRQQYIIARGMTRQQAVQLTDTLSADRPSQRARLIGQVPAHLPGVAKLDRQDTTPNFAQSQPATAEAKSAAIPHEGDVDGDGAAVQQQAQQAPTSELPAATAATQSTTTGPIQPAEVASTAPATQSEPGLDVVILVEDESPAAPAPTTTTAPTSPATQSAQEY